MSTLPTFETARLFRQRIVFSVLLSTSCLAGTAHARSCEMPPPTVSIVESDAPDCLEMEVLEDEELTVLNNCETTYTIINVWAARLPSDAEGTGGRWYDKGDVRLRPGRRAAIDQRAGVEAGLEDTYDESLGWRNESGETGAVELEYIYQEHACGFLGGCDVMAAEAAPRGHVVSLRTSRPLGSRSPTGIGRSLLG